MKKRNWVKIIGITAAVVVVALGFLGMVGLVGMPDNPYYNKQITDLNHLHFSYAVLTRYDGEQIIPIKSWTDFEDGDQIQFTSTDGITYLTHSSQVILLSDLEPNFNS